MSTPVARSEDQQPHELRRSAVGFSGVLPAAATWMVIGIGYLTWLNVRAPARIVETKRVFDQRGRPRSWTC